VGADEPKASGATLWVAFLFHRPGLRLFAPQPISTRVRRANVAAALATLAAIAVAVALAPIGHRQMAGFLTWFAGHVGWGAYLAINLHRQSPLTR
jgi:hypothetical protein